MASMQRAPGSLAYGMAQPVPITPTPFGYQPPTPRTFTGTAPTATPTAGFVAPDPSTFARSPDSLYLQSEQQKALQRGAAAKGTLLTGGLQKALQANAEGLASTDYGNQFTRDLEAYGANRATNAQNFGQSMDSYNGSLAGFNANTNADLGYGRLGLEGAEATYGVGRTNALDNQSFLQATSNADAARNAAAEQQQAEEYARQVEEQRQNNALQVRKPTVNLAEQNAAAQQFWPSLYPPGSQISVGGAVRSRGSLR